MATITTRAGKGSPLTNSEVDSNFTNLNTDKLEDTDLSVSTASASGGGSLSYSSAVFTFTPPDLTSYLTDLSGSDTDDLSEGATNLYFTSERVDDRVNALLQAGSGIALTYDDANNELTIDSDHIEYDATNNTGSTISKGTPVYQTGTSGNTITISPADSDGSGTMPAIGMTSEDIANAATGKVTFLGIVKGFDTSSFTEGDVLYVGTTAGSLTATRPTGSGSAVQNFCRVISSHATSGSVVVMGAGRSNDVPNLTDGHVFIGNSSSTYDKRALLTADISDLTATSTELNYTDGVTSNIQTQLDGKENADATILKDADIGSTVLAYDSNLQSFVTTFTLPTSDGTSGQSLTTNGSGTLAFSNVDADTLDGQHGAYFDDRTINALGSVSGTTDIDLADGTNVTATIGAATTFTVSGLTSGKVNTVTMYLTNAGAYTVTWPSGTVFNRNTAPTLPSAGDTLIVLETYDNGTSWAGIQVWRDTA